MPVKKAFGSTYQAILFVSIFSLIISCGKIPFAFPELPPGDRDYVWTVDTLSVPYNPFIVLFKIWGSDTANVWTVGLGGSEGMWHFDGRTWSICESKSYIDPRSIFGFDRNNSWIGTSSSSIWKFSERNWSVFWKQGLNGYPYILYQEIWGPSLDEIYAVGYGEDSTRKKFRSIISKYDGTSWKILNIPDAGIYIYYIRKQRKSGVLLFSGRMLNQLNDIYKVYSYDGKTMKELYSGETVAAMNDMNGEVYIDIKQQIFKYKDGKLILWKDFRNTCYIARVWGRHENDFFFGTLVNGKNGIGHYNGTDAKVIFQAEPYFGVFEAVIFEKEVFFLGYDINTSKSIIVHGKLKGG